MSKKIVCKSCGEVPFYTNFEVQKVYICFDSDGHEVDNTMDIYGLRSSIVNRCPYCQKKIRIVEENRNESIPG